MSFDTYANLQAEIYDELARPDLAAKVPSWIALLESEASVDLSYRLMDQRATASVDINSSEPQYVSLPSDFNAMKWIRLSGVSTKPKLEYMTPVQIDEFITSSGDATGQPQYFTLFGTELMLAPTPGSAYTLEMLYRQNIPPLATNSTNWLLTNFPHYYFYGALKHSAPYLKDDDRIVLWQTLYQAAKDGINQQGITAGFNGSPVTIRISGPTP